MLVLILKMVPWGVAGGAVADGLAAWDTPSPSSPMASWTSFSTRNICSTMLLFASISSACWAGSRTPHASRRWKEIAAPRSAAAREDGGAVGRRRRVVQQSTTVKSADSIPV